MKRQEKDREKRNRKEREEKQVTTTDLGCLEVPFSFFCHWGGWGCGGACADGCGVGSAVWWSLSIGPGAVARQNVSSTMCHVCTILAVLLPLHGGCGGLWLGEAPETILSKTDSWLFHCICTQPVFVLQLSQEWKFFVLKPSQDCYNFVSLANSYPPVGKRTGIHSSSSI